MVNQNLYELIFQFGGLGAVVGFAYILLRAHLKQLDRISKSLENHLGHDEEALMIIRKSLFEILRKLERLNK